MGHSQADKERTHERIVSVAAKRLREEGLQGIGVADLMKDAGLTVGGFYKHFTSREDLVVQALAAALGTWDVAVATAEREGTPPGEVLGQLIDRYLSPAHRDDPGKGCVFAALAADVARGSDDARVLLSRRLADDVELLTALFAAPAAPAAPDAPDAPEAPDAPDAARKEARAQALLAMSAMVGAVSLARIARDSPLSDEILEVVAGSLASLTSAGG